MVDRDPSVPARPGFFTCTSGLHRASTPSSWLTRGWQRWSSPPSTVWAPGCSMGDLKCFSWALPACHPSSLGGPTGRSGSAASLETQQPASFQKSCCSPQTHTTPTFPPRETKQALGLSPAMPLYVTSKRTMHFGAMGTAGQSWCKLSRTGGRPSEGPATLTSRCFLLGRAGKQWEYSPLLFPHPPWSPRKES